MADVGGEQGTGLQSYMVSIHSPTTYISKFYIGYTMCVVCNICFEPYKCRSAMIMVVSDKGNPHLHWECDVNFSMIHGCRRCQG